MSEFLQEKEISADYLAELRNNARVKTQIVQFEDESSQYLRIDFHIKVYLHSSTFPEKGFQPFLEAISWKSSYYATESDMVGLAIQSQKRLQHPKEELHSPLLEHKSCKTVQFQGHRLSQRGFKQLQLLFQTDLAMVADIVFKLVYLLHTEHKNDGLGICLIPIPRLLHKFQKSFCVP
jgi:hypothetical protein